MSNAVVIGLLTAVAAALPAYLLRFHTFGVPTTLLELFVLATIVSAFLLLIRNRKSSPSTLYRLPVPWLMAVALFVIAGTISVVTAPDTRAALGLWKAYIIEPVALFFVALWVLRTEKDRRKIVIALACSGIFVAVVGIWQKFHPDGLFGLWAIPHSATNEAWYGEATRRITSVFPFPNAVGLFLAPVTVMLRGILLHSVRHFTHGKKKIDPPQFALFLLLLASSFLMVLTVYWAGSHGGLVGIIAGATVLGLVSEHWRKLSIVAIVLALSAFFFSASAHNFIIEEFGGHENSVAIRELQSRETYECLKLSTKTFVFGGGLSGYKQLVTPCHKSTAIEIYQYPHNIVFNFWSEMGLLGLGSFFAIVILFYTRGIQFVFWTRKTRVRNPDLFHPSTIALPSALLGAMTALLVHGLVDVPYFKNDLAILFWLLVALMLCSTESSRKRSDDEPTLRI